MCFRTAGYQKLFAMMMRIRLTKRRRFTSAQTIALYCFSHYEHYILLAESLTLNIGWGSDGQADQLELQEICRKSRRKGYRFFSLHCLRFPRLWTTLPRTPRAALTPASSFLLDARSWQVIGDARPGSYERWSGLKGIQRRGPLGWPA